MLTTSSALTWPAHDAAAASVVARPDPRAEWKLTRRCSVSPRQLMFGLGLVGLVSLAIGLSFCWLGAGPVLLFSGLEIAVLAAALVSHARHACDGDTVVVSRGVLAVESRRGTSLTRWVADLEGLRVQDPEDDRSFVRIVRPGTVVEVGSQVPHARRLAFARELRQVVRTGRCSLPDGTQIWS